MGRIENFETVHLPLTIPVDGLVVSEKMVATVREIEKNGGVVVSQGTEGPKHDPYSFVEIAFKLKGVGYEIHSGLYEYLLVVPKNKMPDRLDQTEGRFLFEKLTGWNMYDFQVFVEMAQQEMHDIQVCTKCGCEDLRWMGGMPGESFLMCVKCGECLDSHMNLAAIE